MYPTHHGLNEVLGNPAGKRDGVKTSRQCCRVLWHTPHTQELGSRYVAGDVPCSSLSEDCGGLEAGELGKAGGGGGDTMEMMSYTLMP